MKHIWLLTLITCLYGCAYGRDPNILGVWEPYEPIVLNDENKGLLVFYSMCFLDGKRGRNDGYNIYINKKKSWITFNTYYTELVEVGTHKLKVDDFLAEKIIDRNLFAFDIKVEPNTIRYFRLNEFGSVSNNNMRIDFEILFDEVPASVGREEVKDCVWTRKEYRSVEAAAGYR